MYRQQKSKTEWKSKAEQLTIKRSGTEMTAVMESDEDIENGWVERSTSERLGSTKQLKRVPSSYFRLCV
jgi:hypothetical protein